MGGPTTPVTVSLPMVRRDQTRFDLVVWHTIAGAYSAEYDQVITEYDAAHPQVTITWIYRADLPAALAVAIPAGTGPDLIYCANDRIGSYAQAGYLAPIESMVSQSYLNANFEPAAAKAMPWNGHVWGIPESQEGIALVYNKAILSAGQLPNPDDFADLRARADQFHQLHLTKYYVCNQGLGNDDAYHVAPIFFGMGMNAYGGYVDEAGNVYLDTIEAFNTASWVNSFRPYAPAVTGHEICRDMLVNGQAAIWWTGPWAIADLEAAGVNYGIALMGRPFAGIKGTMLTTNTVSRNNTHGAIGLMRHLGSTAVQERLALANRTIPANSAALHDPAVQSLPSVAGFDASLNRGVPMASTPYMECAWAPVGSAVANIWTGAQGPSTALGVAQAAIEACIDAMQP
jgi:arabinogalactan oligomer/maltooligosaccharide transport system substrate-binding protein